MQIEDEIKQASFKDEHQKLAVNLIYTQACFDTLFSQALKGYSITPEQFNVLRILKGSYPKPMAVKDVQERMINKMSNTSRLIEKLRSKGFLERIACEYDRRAVDVTLTPLGLEQLETYNKEIEPIYQHYKTLSVEEAKQLNNLLDKLRGNNK